MKSRFVKPSFRYMARRRFVRSGFGSSILVLAQPAMAQMSSSSIAETGLTPAALVDRIAGAGVSFSNSVLTGSDLAAGTFSGAMLVLGASEGVVLGTGWVAELDNTNDSPDRSMSLGEPGNAALEGFPGVGATADAVSVEFDFTCPAGLNQVQLQYALASDEHSELFGLEPITVPLPPGLGRVVNPDGSFSPATSARLVPSKTGVKTAYPIR